MNNLKDIVDSINAGNYGVSTWRKLPTTATVVGTWFDLSMSSGNPIPQYYASSPLVGVAMGKSDLGVNYAAGSSTQSTYLKSITAMTTAASINSTLMLLDYLMFYPFTDDGTLDEQILSGSPTRYTDGKGVQMMAISVAGRTGGQKFTVKYTNQDGVEGRITPVHTQYTAAVTGNIATTNAGSTVGLPVNLTGPFLTLQQGDTGVRRIESITMNGVDVGLMTLVLVKPVGTINHFGASPIEKCFISNTGLLLHPIHSNAYLNFIIYANANVNGSAWHGILETFWK